ncbi:hypothetical protein RR48_04382 [Papilio machaon]|uniref:Uncharacterized protein n=1 Tax=Papilio machaon TaxID=76193 RepID=A0A0N1PFZ4_PAPMA|nr:hypothetical protein RR48_04382 [Papilio machaon]
MAVICTKVVKRHFCQALQKSTKSPIFYGRERICSRVLTKPLFSNTYKHNIITFSNSAINKHFAIPK